MNKIITVALASAKPSVESLLELINATSNPTVATEILLGIYEDPTINPIPAFENTSETNIQFGSYDKFTEEVSYTYNKVDTFNGWVLNSLETIADNVYSRNMWAEDVAESLTISVETFKKNYTRHTFVTNVATNLSTASVSLKKWNTGSSK
jgi:hypothetical protein